MGDGLLFGPDIVMVPQFYVIGKYYDVPFHDTLIAQKAAIDFWKNERYKISNTVDQNVYIGMTKDGRNNDEISVYLTSCRCGHLILFPIRRIRQRTGLSQVMFAGSLGVSPKTVEVWENGRNKPEGASRCLLEVVRDDPEFLQRFWVAVMVSCIKN